MKKRFLLIPLLLSTIILNAQNFVTSAPITVAPGSGNYHPQMEVLGDGELGVIWTDAVGNDIYFSKRNGIDQFAAPIQLNPTGVDVQDYNWSGADLIVEGNNIYVVFRSAGYETGHCYLVKSADNGLTFSDTVRIDNLAVGYAQYPDVTVFNDTVFVTYMKHDAGSMNPRYVSARSVDGGLTFETEVEAGSLLGNEACDCCQPEIIADGEKVIIFFRNNASNIRDIKAVVSYDRGATFTNWFSVDDHNWLITSCPSTGPDARFIDADIVVSAYRSYVSGAPKIFLNEYNVTTDVSLNTIDISMDGVTPSGINYPQIAYAGNLLAIVWEGLGTSTDVFFNASSTGVTGINSSNAINVTDEISSQSKPDVAILNGTFHIVYSELSGSVVKYCRVNATVDIDEPVSYSATIYPNPTNGQLKIYLPESIDQSISINILASDGQCIENISAIADEEFIQLDLDHLATGIYFIEFMSEDRTEVHRIVKY